jgi:hypothetical protein
MALHSAVGRPPGGSQSFQRPKNYGNTTQFVTSEDCYCRLLNRKWFARMRRCEFRREVKLDYLVLTPQSTTPSLVELFEDTLAHLVQMLQLSAARQVVYHIPVVNTKVRVTSLGYGI